jgi:hypothetical protein
MNSAEQDTLRTLFNRSLSLLDAEAKYRWWQGGQSVAETLAELQGANAPIAQGRGQAD